jgi:phenylacetate-CoA ligase
VVGVAGFEPATTRSQSECATGLRYTPTDHCYFTIRTPGGTDRRHALQDQSAALDQQLSRATAEAGESRAITLFHETVRSVPAYRALLTENGVDPATIRDLDSFRRLPCVTKQNYIQRHPLPDLCRSGRLDACDMMAVSSGSTGAPTFWPRNVADELNIVTRFEQIFHDSFRADERSTLAVVCFALGTWVGGMYTAACCRHLAAKGYRITTVTPGSNRDEILRVVRELGGYYDQTVLLGYPPFVKDVIEAGAARGFEWSQYNIKLVMAGEVFSEEWRSLVGNRTGSQSPCFDSASLYGTADAGVLANETPLSISIRRWLSSQPDSAHALFGESRLPTVAQYDPTSRYFELVDGHLVFTGDNGVPLIRYDILDTGGIVAYEEMIAFAGERGFDPVADLSGPSGTPPRRIRPLPFVYVFGRSDFTVSFFGANIYPENVKVALEQPPICEWVTGKFVLESLADEDRNRRLSVTIELAAQVAADEEKERAMEREILIQLLRLNSEFANYVPAEYRVPHVHLRPLGDPEYFPTGVKHRYTRRMMK